MTDTMVLEPYHHYQKIRQCGWILEDIRLLDEYQCQLVHPDLIWLKQHLEDFDGIKHI